MSGAHDLQVFTTALRDMALGISGKPMDSERIGAYWEELIEYDLDDVTAAIRLAKRQAKKFIPAVGVIRDLVRQAQNERVTIRPEVAAALASQEIHCTRCDDTGWQYIERAVGDTYSQYYKPGTTHLYARPCPCRGTNMIYQAKRAQERRKAAKGDE